MKYGLDIPTSGEYADPLVLTELAAEAEAAGWDGFFVWDILRDIASIDAPVVDPWIALAAIATRTKRIAIGAMLTPLPRRRPWLVARQTVALDHLSHGRLVFGAGLGYDARDFASFGEDFEIAGRVEKLEEGLEVLRGLWSGEPFSYSGKHYTIDGVTFLPKPLQSPRIPVWLATGWPNRKPLRRAAQWDGVYLMTVNQQTNQPLTPDEIREAAAYVREHRTSAEPFDIAFAGLTPSDSAQGAAIVQPYLDSGATWWLEYAADNQTFADYRERIRSGPPHL